MNCNCENCGWSEIIGSLIMCHYTGLRTWRDECCEAWKPKNIVEVVRCKDCQNGEPGDCGYGIDCDGVWHYDDWFCADGIRKESW